MLSKNKMLQDISAQNGPPVARSLSLSLSAGQINKNRQRSRAGNKIIQSCSVDGDSESKLKIIKLSHLSQQKQILPTIAQWYGRADLFFSIRPKIYVTFLFSVSAKLLFSYLFSTNLRGLFSMFTQLCLFANSHKMFIFLFHFLSISVSSDSKSAWYLSSFFAFH